MYLLKIANMILSATLLVSAAPPASGGDLPTVVFTPGAWHGPQSFDLVRDGLARKGYASEAVTLPTVGAESPDVGVEEDAAALRTTLEALANTGKQIVLVVHSYGGLVGGNAVSGLGWQQRAANNETGGVIMLMYISALAAPVGISIMDVFGGELPPWIRIDGWKVFADTPEVVFYTDVDPVLRAKAVSELSWEPERVFYDPSTYEPWNEGIEVMYFVCLQDQAYSPANQEAAAAQFPPGSAIFYANTSHSPFLSRPDLVIEGVELAVKNGQSKLV